MLGEIVSGFNLMLVDTFDKPCNVCLYMVQYHLLDNMGQDLQKFGRLSVLDRSL